MLTREQIGEFLDRLDGPEGCDFREEIPGDPNSIRWQCAGGNDKSYAMGILDAMGVSPADRDALLARCDELGGHCDCEILFNAGERLLAEADNGERDSPER